MGSTLPGELQSTTQSLCELNSVTSNGPHHIYFLGSSSTVRFSGTHKRDDEAAAESAAVDTAVKTSHTALLGHVYTCFFLLSLELSNIVKEICFSNPVGCRNYLSSPLLQAVQTGLHVHKGMPGLRYESGSTLGFICEQTGADALTTEEWQLPTAGTQEHCPHLLSPAPPAT